MKKGRKQENKIKQEGLCLRNLGETLVEDYASASSMLEYIKSIPHVKASIAVEARSPKVADVAEAQSVRAGQFTFFFSTSLFCVPLFPSKPIPVLFCFAYFLFFEL
ncbi:MAG: hypothetical protein QXS17_00595 [Candidatus Micrarchaeaceae archaeon]